jgi:hypothetical protein
MSAAEHDWLQALSGPLTEAAASTQRAFDGRRRRDDLRGADRDRGGAEADGTVDEGLPRHAVNGRPVWGTRDRFRNAVARR